MYISIDDQVIPKELIYYFIRYQALKEEIMEVIYFLFYFKMQVRKICKNEILAADIVEKKCKEVEHKLQKNGANRGLKEDPLK